ncbi:MAG: DUF523 domain-containing protein [Clostridia bacterium]|nr:DUF523 domain-containing protein [Clostridia bacterium]
MIIVSACLAGVNCKYNGGNNVNEYVRKLVAQGKAIPVCPEQLGGFGTPRLTTEISGGTGAEVLDGICKVIRKTGEDVAEGFIRGAYEVLKIAETVGAKKAIMKSKSPSCGFGKIYDGSFSGNLIDGNGVTAELLKRKGIEVVTERDI